MPTGLHLSFYSLSFSVFLFYPNHPLSLFYSPARRLTFPCSPPSPLHSDPLFGVPVAEAPKGCGEAGFDFQTTTRFFGQDGAWKGKPAQMVPLRGTEQVRGKHMVQDPRPLSERPNFAESYRQIRGPQGWV